MRGKWTTIFLASIIGLLCLYQLSFTWKEAKIKEEIQAFADSKAAAAPEAEQDSVRRSAVRAYRDSINDKEVFLGQTYQNVRDFALDLGLDLQGGMHVTLAIDQAEILRGFSDYSTDQDFEEALVQAEKESKTSQDPFADLFYAAYKSKAGDNKLALIFSETLDLDPDASDEEIEKVLNDKLDGAIDRAEMILRERLDRSGTTNPIIQTIKSTGRIAIQLPGVDDEERVLKQLQAVAKLEFLEVWEGNDVFPHYQRLNEYLVAKGESEAKAEDKPEAAPSTVDDDLFSDDTEPSDSSLVEESDDTEADTAAVAAADTAEQDVLAEEPVDSTLAEDNTFPIQKYIVFGQDGRGGVYFMAKRSEYEKINALFNDPEVKKFWPANFTMLWGTLSSQEKKEGKTEWYPVYFAKRGGSDEALLTGEVIERASQSYDQMGRVTVSMQMNVTGGMQWKKITTENRGKRIAIVLDNVVYSAPTINEPIPNGSSQISGGFSIQEAQDLANILEAGESPAPTVVEQLATVGPSLGKESINKGLISLIAGLACVIIFMIAYYGKGGFVADIALLFNIFFILGILATPYFNATLTLPGIAGIVLTIGMSIDANVLIFERIREEQALGRPTLDAINEGFKKALLTIVDANVTTLIAAVVLNIFGSGLIKGFATTLMIGIFCSFFSAVFITRLIIHAMTSKNDGEGANFETGLSKTLLKDAAFDFIGKRKMAYMISGAIIVVGLGISMTKGMNLGVAFKGGYQYVISFNQDVKVNDIRTALKQSYGEGTDVEVKTFDKNNQVQVVTNFMVDSEEPNAHDIVREKTLSSLDAGLGAEILSSNEVNPTIADDIKRNAVESIAIALILIFGYIIIRFGKWQFGMGALAALFHDVLFLIATFAIVNLLGASFSIDEIFVAALLTIVGYSINDTVVVFDRVREYLIGNPKEDEAKVLNDSINGTLSRTLMTSVTTLLVVVVLLVFGGDILRGFSFAMLIGVLVGTYSSIFIATPLVLDASKGKLGQQLEKSNERKKEFLEQA